MNSDQYGQLMERASKLISENKLDNAEKILQKLMPHAKGKEKVVVTNNLATIEYARGNVKQALSLLEPYLETGSAIESPYTLGLAAQLSAKLERRNEAEHFLNRAVKVFESKLPALREANIEPQSWYEYTVQLMRAAGILGDHRRVIDLYKKYERYHVSWENRFNAGIAYFNLKRYKQAASIWEPLNRIGNFIIPFQEIAFLLKRDVMPHFELSYKPPEWDKVIEQFKNAGDDHEKQEGALEDGQIRVVLLDTLFGELTGEEEKKNAAKILIKYGRDWGKELGQRLLESALVAYEVKMGALFALVELGVYKEGEEVPVWIDGKETVVRVEKKEVRMEPDQELDQLCERAVALREKGQFKEAIALLEPLQQEGKFYPRAMVTLANLYRNIGEFEPALRIFKPLADIMPEEPVIMINLAGLYIETGQFDQALQCIAEIDNEGIDEKFREQLDYFRRMAEQRLTPGEYTDYLKDGYDAYMDQVEEDLRAEIEEKKITPESNLSRGLKNMPNEWLLMMCEIHDIDPCRLRSQREKAINSHLTNPAHLKQAVQELAADEQELLLYLLNKGGWALLSSVSRKFGKMEGDGFYWYEEEPQSTTGRLWSKGLIMVGKAIHNNRQVKIAAIPADLKPLLESILKL
ncbi:MAG: tetratricopeptide repeat protein [Firmicutes bacterium]|nr:tetratricopeptide repeat protein [Bacillota bacterium]